MTISLPASAQLPTGTWVVDPHHTHVGFAVRHAGVSTVRGLFHDFDGRLVVGEDGPPTASGSVRAASVDTGTPARDDHLRSEDFFDVARHPEITFTSSRIELDGDDVSVAGALTIHGVTRDVELTGDLHGVGTDDEGQLRAGLSLEGRISRADFDMRFNQALGGGNVLVGDKVKLVLDVSAVLQD